MVDHNDSQGLVREIQPPRLVTMNDAEPYVLALSSGVAGEDVTDRAVTDLVDPESSAFTSFNRWYSATLSMRSS